MRSDANLAVQLGLIVVCGFLRLFVTPGWMLLILGLPWLVLVACHITLAAVAVPRRHLTVPVTIAFVTADVGLLGGTLVMPDGGDSDASFHSPLGLLVGHEYPDVTWPAGMLLGVLWAVGLIATMVALIVTRAPRPTFAGYYGPPARPLSPFPPR